MPELTPKERLQPALLQRLRDDEPSRKTESRDKRVVSAQELYKYVRQDLSSLLNTVRLESADQPLSDFPEVTSSVVNYGIPELCGHTLRNMDIPVMQRWLREAILRFEPRILPRTLEVEVRFDQASMNHNRLTFEIRGDLWAYPMPLELLIRTEMDLETGNVTVVEGGH